MLIKNLSFKFTAQDAYFFKDLNLKFEPGKLYFIGGENGVGKSTFFHILQGTNQTDTYLEAYVSLNSTEHQTLNNQLPTTFTRLVHTVYQNTETMIADQFSFLDNLSFANLPKYPNLDRLPQINLFDNLLAHLDINLQCPARLLSGGQQQLLAILLALQKPTKLLLLDEPTAKLDSKNARTIMDFLLRIAQQLDLIILIICHDQGLIKEYATGASLTICKSAHGERIIK